MTGPDAPNRFLIFAGAPKCATTAFCYTLSGHPRIRFCARDKEPKHFTAFADAEWTGPGADAFQASMTRGEADYLGSFGACGPDDWALDGSTDYLWAEGAAERIAAFAETREVRVVIILRDPIERAFSEYVHTRRDGFQKGGFRASLDAEDDRRARRMHPIFYHRRRSAYAGAVDRFRSLLGDRVMLLDYHDVSSRMEAAINEVLAFAGLEPMRIEAARRVNSSAAPISHKVKRLTKSPRARALARSLTPPAWRDRIYRAVLRLNDRRERLSQRDADHAFTLMAEEIRSCFDHPHIPTRNWRTAIAARDRMDGLAAR